MHGYADVRWEWIQGKGIAWAHNKVNIKTALVYISLGYPPLLFIKDLFPIFGIGC